jgi:hypothetical protein
MKIFALKIFILFSLFVGILYSAGFEARAQDTRVKCRAFLLDRHPTRTPVYQASNMQLHRMVWDEHSNVGIKVRKILDKKGYQILSSCQYTSANSCYFKKDCKDDPYQNPDKFVCGSIATKPGDVLIHYTVAIDTHTEHDMNFNPYDTCYTYLYVSKFEEKTDKISLEEKFSKVRQKRKVNLKYDAISCGEDFFSKLFKDVPDCEKLDELHSSTDKAK